MSRHRRHPRIDRVLEYMRRPSHGAPEEVGSAPASYLIKRKNPERLEYEGPIVVSVVGHGCALITLADAPGQTSDELAELVYEMIDPPLEDMGHRSDVDVYARVVVEILPDPRPEVLP